MDGSYDLKGAADAPFYLAQGDECDIFAAAFKNNTFTFAASTAAAACRGQINFCISKRIKQFITNRRFY